MIVRLNGGLGNQMFQYAFGRCVSAERYINVSFHRVGLDDGNHRAYSLGAFNVNVIFQDPDKDTPIYQEATFAYDSEVFSAPADSYFIGNWQTERYFDERLVRQHFFLKYPISAQSEAMLTRIKRFVSVSVHVRRTDYLVESTAAYHGNMTSEYYCNAIDYMRARIPYARFFIFSDDPSWCRENFVGPDLEVVDINDFGNGTSGPGKEHEDLYLMSQCDHAIIPNSSFGWWGAWLNPNKFRLVIAPKNWFAPATKLDTADIIPTRWVTI